MQRLMKVTRQSGEVDAPHANDDFNVKTEEKMCNDYEYYSHR